MRCLVLLTLLSACASSPAPTVFVGPRFDRGEGVVPALAISVDGDGRILRLHDHLPVEGRIVTVPGQVAIVGLGDAHLHLMWLARGLESVDLSASTSPGAAAAAVAAHAAAHPEAAIVAGQGWDQTRWLGGSAAAFPTARDLAPDVHGRPIVLERVDGHVYWLDANALAKITDLLSEPSPPPEQVMRDASGAPTGIIVDARAAITKRLSPTPDARDLRRWLVASMAMAADVGLVEVHDMGTTPEALAVLTALQAEGRLPLHLVLYLDRSEPSFAWLAAHAPGPTRLGPDLEVRGTKLFADGALGSRGAALHADYSDQPGHRGQATPPEELTRDALRTARLGYQVAIHAIGDRGNANALSALEAARAAAGAGFRGRIEHAQVIDLHDVARFVAGGFVASMQPTHATSDMRWAEARIGPERLRGAYAWRTLLDAGVALAFGTDAPVESFDPRLTLWAATTRQTLAGEPAGGWHPEQRVTFDEAVRAESFGVSYAAQGEHERGQLAPGQLLQLTVFDRDPRAALQAAKVTATVRGSMVRPVD